MMRLIIIVSFIQLVLFPVTLSTPLSCLTYFDGADCEKIQMSGAEVAKRIKEINVIIKEVIVRSIHTMESVYTSSMTFLKEEAKKIVKVKKTGITPIDTSKLNEFKKKFINVATTSVKSANYKFWLLLKEAAKEALQDDLVGNALLTYPGSKTGVKGTKNAPSNHGLTGILDKSKPKMKVILSLIDKDLKAVSKKVFTLCFDSLQKLLQGQMAIDFVKVKSNLEKKISDTTAITVDSILEHGIEILRESMQNIEEIDSTVDKMKTNPDKLQVVLKPATELVYENIENIQNGGDDEGIQKSVENLVQLLKTAFSDVKKTLTL